MQDFIDFFGKYNKNALYLPAGECKVSFVDVRDIAPQHKGKSYNITGPEALGGDAALILSNELGINQRCLMSGDSFSKLPLVSYLLR